MIENRMAMAQQLSETSQLLKHVSESLYEITQADPQMEEQLRKKLKKRQILLKQAWVMDRVEGKRQVFLTMRARGGQCISMTEAAQVLSEVCHCAMAPAEGSRCIVNGEFHLTQFVEDTAFQVRFGVSRLTREDEQVSGDNYICRQEDGRFVMCLSDGMGSGMDACRESETVVELLEQFLESGFTQETAARMVNSALVLNGRDGMFSTVDMCALDLYSGICSFLKAGASATFIRRDHWVESIESESLAAGLVQQMDFESVSRKLYHGDYLIMMTDGVLDALPLDREEDTMKEIILDVGEDTPKEMSRGILERVLGYCDFHARDDMTILVAGIWKK
jgi:stage II sporulation protein E